jgi:hypothetical protein
VDPIAIDVRQADEVGAQLRQAPSVAVDDFPIGLAVLGVRVQCAGLEAEAPEACRRAVGERQLAALGLEEAVPSGRFVIQIAQVDEGGVRLQGAGEPGSLRLAHV